MKTYLFRFISSIFRIYNIIKSKPRANGRNIAGYFLLRPFAALLHVVGSSLAQSLKMVKLLAKRKRRQQLPTFLGQQSWELLHPFARIALQSTYRSNTLSTYLFYLLTHVKPPTRSSLANDYVNIETAH